MAKNQATTVAKDVQLDVQKFVESGVFTTTSPLTAEEQAALDLLIGGNSVFGDLLKSKNYVEATQWSIVKGSLKYIMKQVLPAIKYIRMVEYNNEKYPRAIMRLVDGSYAFLDIAKACEQRYDLQKGDEIDPRSLCSFVVVNADASKEILVFWGVKLNK